MILSRPADPSPPGPEVALGDVEFWVTDLAEARFHTSKFGFEPTAPGSETLPEEARASLACGGASLILRQGTTASSPISRHVAKHGDSIAVVGLVVGDVGELSDRALAGGLKVMETGEGLQIDLLGDGSIVHSLRSRGRTSPPEPRMRPNGPRLLGIDHITYCLPWGTMDRVAAAYRDVLAFEHTYAQDVEPEDQGVPSDRTGGMRSTVLRSPLGLTIVLTEPSSPAGDGQTHRFLRSHAGAGVQHVALAYDDLVSAIGTLRSRGVPFLPVPEEHLKRSHDRMRGRPLPWDALRDHEILVDADEHGILFQRFARPITERSSFFFEVIQRAGALGFGAANVQALFAAVEAGLRVSDRTRNVD
jgi:4-hydroxymandelate synthase